MLMTHPNVQHGHDSIDHFDTSGLYFWATSLDHSIGGGELLPCFFPQMNDNFRHVLNYEAPLTAGNVGTCPRGALEQGHCHQG